MSETQANTNYSTLEETMENAKNINDDNGIDATEQDIQELAKIAEFYESFFYKKDRWYEIDEEKSAEANLSETQRNEIKEYLVTKNQLSDDTGLNLARAKWMFYGRYCGKGNNGGKPIDDLDAACKRHDDCYAKYGWGKCKCDRPFIKTTQKIAGNTKNSYTKRKKAIQAAALFALAYNRCR